MNRLERRAVIAGGALLACGLIAPAARPSTPRSRAHEPPLDALVPRQIGAWGMVDAAGIVLPPADLLTERVYGALLARRYAAAGQPAISLVIAYGAAQDYALQLHRPEVCYPASGYAVRSVEPRELALGQARIPGSALLAARSGRTDAVLFWTRIGSSYPQGVWEARRAIAGSILGGTLPDGVLVRLSASADWADRPFAPLEAFAAELAQAVEPAGRRLLFGNGAA